MPVLPKLNIFAVLDHSKVTKYMTMIAEINN